MRRVALTMPLYFRIVQKIMSVFQDQSLNTGKVGVV